MKEGSGVGKWQGTRDEGHGKYTFVLAVVCCLWSVVCSSQDTVQLSVFKKYPFVHSERNEIVNAGALDGFFEKLLQQKKQNSRRVSVLHIGDSHIQADMITAPLRTGFQKDFGNAGRGLVIPLRVSGSNEPFSYKISSNLKWFGKRCVYVSDTLHYGIGGYLARTYNDSAVLTIRTNNYAPLNYAFNKLTLFYQHDSSFTYVLYDTSGNRLATLGADSVQAFLNYSTVRLPQYTNTAVIKLERNDTVVQKHATIYGFNLENDSNGVLYHVVGVNGAEAYQYVAAKNFAVQTALLVPDVIIISLGTNEGQRRPFDKVVQEAKLDSMVKQLQLCNPNVPVILTSPPDSYYRRKYYNTAIAAYHEMMVDYAKKNNLAVWDLFAVTGGHKSCYQWKKYGLMQRDGVHFTRAGYELQGNLLYEALLKAYNQYARH
ncbi:MAG TPA: GDSL-type esterase/lipase family protein [Chitinophagales bacterium]|nr:GDSL-type esterase/lipase family protein [Chitinophagales bacterium]